MHNKKHLQFSALRQSLSKHFRATDDKRQKGKLDHQLHDCLMAAFAMMFFQDPSVLEFQKRLKDLESQMKTAAKALDFEKAALLRDRIFELRKEFDYAEIKIGR